MSVYLLFLFKNQINGRDQYAVLHLFVSQQECKPPPRFKTSNIAYECNDKKSVKNFLDPDSDPDLQQN